MPWVMMVDSSATTGEPFSMASNTSFDMFIGPRKENKQAKLVSEWT